MIHEGGPVTEEIFGEKAAKAEIIIGQIDLPEPRLKRATSLRAVFNVEGNFLPNIDYAYCFRHGIRVLNISPVFAEPVAEAALGMAIDLARGITRSDRHFRQGTEQYGLAANAEAFSLFRQAIGFYRVRRSRSCDPAIASPVRLPRSRIRSVAASRIYSNLGV